MSLKCTRRSLECHDLGDVRVRDDMKVTATAHIKAQAKTKADKQEKLNKLRDSVQDAAARTIQQMYYVFSVSAAAVFLEINTPLPEACIWRSMRPHPSDGTSLPCSSRTVCSMTLC